MLERLYAPPRDRLLLATNDVRVLGLAERLWERADEEASEVAPIRMEVLSAPGAPPQAAAEKEIAWTHGAEAYEMHLGDLLHTRMTLAETRVWARLSEGLLDQAPDLVARYALEVPSAVFLERRAHTVLHAGAVVGPLGAVVIRGASGAGKSTLVAACFAAGLSVLGDESLLVARRDPDALASSVRDLTLRHDSALLVGVRGTSVAFSGGEEKVRVDLFPGSSPRDRSARRVATFLLGPREPGPARLVPLPPGAFEDEFAKGAIPQETDAAAVALDWAARAGFRLDGAADLDGAVELVLTHTGEPSRD